MGAGFVLAFWLFLAAIYGCFWLMFLALFVSGRRKKSGLLTWLGGIPLALSTGFAVLCIGMMIYGLISVSKPANVYEISFGSQPPADVTNMQSSYYCFADTGTAFLKFNSPPVTVGKLTAKGWVRLTGQKLRAENFSNFTGEGTPSWWKPNKSKTTSVYAAENRFGNFAGEYEVLTYDAVTKQVHYAFIGID
jgi:hypothetical protein